MTREIKFRGKRLDNGEWVYGDLFQIGVRPAKAIWTIAEEDWIEIDPATVGEYTGLKDKNGREIYEGDIVRIDWMNDLYSVVYDCASFLISATGTIRHDLFNVVKGAEVLGNINDNPELLDK